MRVLMARLSSPSGTDEMTRGTSCSQTELLLPFYAIAAIAPGKYGCVLYTMVQSFGADTCMRQTDCIFVKYFAI